MLRQAVDALVRQYGTNNPFVLSRCLNIHLMPRKTPNGMWGIFVWHHEHAFLGYDEVATLPKQHEFVAHGIGHYVLHCHSEALFIEMENPGCCSAEQEAQTFADLLLRGVTGTAGWAR